MLLSSHVLARAPIGPSPLAAGAAHHSNLTFLRPTHAACSMRLIDAVSVALA